MPQGAAALFALGPLAGAVMGGAWGAHDRRGAALDPAPASAHCAGLRSCGPLGPLLGILLSVWRFYSSPVIFAFDPFFGFFSGTLYDTVVEATAPLLTYRLGSALTLIAAGMFAAHLVHDEDGKLALRSLRRPGMPLLGAVAATASLMLVLEGWRLGHWQTIATIERDLGARVSWRPLRRRLSALDARRRSALVRARLRRTIALGRKLFRSTRQSAG